MTNRADQIVARALQHLSDIKTAMHTTMEPGNGCPCQAQSGKVDLLIVSDSSHSNELNLTLINKIKDQAIASIDCVDDARVHFLPVTYQAPTIDVKIGNGQTETVTSVWGHLLNLGVSPENIRHNHNEDIGPAVLDLLAHHPWREGACRAIFVIADELYEDGEGRWGTPSPGLDDAVPGQSYYGLTPQDQQVMEEVIATAQAAEVKIFELYTRPYSRPDTWFETKLAGGSFSQADQDRWHQQYDLVRSWHEKVTRATTQPQDRSIFFLENIFDFDWKPGDSPIPDGQWATYFRIDTGELLPQKKAAWASMIQAFFEKALNAVVCNACSDCTALVIEPCFELSWGTAEEPDLTTGACKSLLITVHNCYANLRLNRVVILLITVTDAEGNEVTIPTVTPAGLVCFDQVGPCEEVSRQLVLSTHGLAPGQYTITLSYTLGGVTFIEPEPKLSSTVAFPITVHSA